MEITASYLRNLLTHNLQANSEQNKKSVELIQKQTDEDLASKVANMLPRHDDPVYRAKEIEYFESIGAGQLQNATWISIETRFNAVEDTQKVNKELVPTQNTMKNVYEHMHADLAKHNPALATKDFGFSLNHDGSLMVLERNSSLNQNEIDSLNHWLNSSDSLKSLANKYAKLTIEYTKVAHVVSSNNGNLDAVLNGGGYLEAGGYNLNMNNFHTTIDLEQAIDPARTGKPDDWSFPGFWLNQLYSKGEKRPISEFISTGDFVNNLPVWKG